MRRRTFIAALGGAAEHVTAPGKYQTARREKR
jgi:hypothetical protein